ncbi:MAG TPA: histidine kinase dimerization/phospho-acceptor domain-containing protein [Vicinamibacterales bacterium]|nr:histidine kinase dimerization/phospho-acceptor domain-containing protein [Vicinamibacterales bacterium]
MVGEAAILLCALGMASTAAAWRRQQRKTATVSEARLRRAAVALTQTGEDFLPAVVQEISSSLGAALAFVGEFTAEGQIQTVAANRGGQPAANFVFSSHDSPCAQLSAHPDFHHADDVQRLFPRDTLLAGVNARGCVGVVLADTRHAPIGVIVAATTSPLEDSADAISLLALFAARVAAEMQRARTERELRQREEHLLQVQRVEAVGRLAGGIAHDFNNLLMIMIGYAEILRDREGASLEITELLAAANRATKLTRQLLAFGRRQVLQTQRVDLNHVVTQVQTMLTPLIGAQVRLQTSLARRLPAVEADPGQFEQVLVNLALNARDAMPNGGTLRLETRTDRLEEAYYQMPPGDYVCLAVSDTGIGMSPEVQATHLRTVLHDEGQRRHRPWTVQRVRDRQAERRLHLVQQRARARNNVHDLPAPR